MTAYQLKLILAGKKPEVWRRVNVPSSATFDQLHQVIQAVMFWENCHLYWFELPRHGLRLCRNINELIKCDEDSVICLNGGKPQGSQRFRKLHSGEKKLKDLLETEEEFRYRYECALGREVRILVEGQVEIPLFYGAHCVDGKNASPGDDGEGCSWDDLKNGKSPLNGIAGRGFDLLEAENKVRSLVIDYSQEMFHIRELRGVMDTLISSLTLEEPCCVSLFDILSALPLKRVRDMADSFDVPEADTAQRSRLEEQISQELLDENYVSYHGIYTGEQGLNLLEIAALGEMIPYEQAYCADLMPLIVGGLLYPFRTEAGVVFLMPDELAELFLELEEDDMFWEDRYQEQDFNRFFKAAANLYGMVSVYDLVRIYNEYVPSEYETDEEEMIDMIDTFAGYNLCEYVMRGEYLSSVRLELETELRDRLPRRRTDVSLHVPKTREALDRFAKADYYERTKVHQRLKRFFTDRTGEDNVGADSLLDLLNTFLQLGKEPTELLELFEEYAISLSSEEEINQLFGELLELRRYTRLWELGGHMEAELRESRETEGKVISLITGKPIEDRDPCPCGSGRAFAECCGIKANKEK